MAVSPLARVALRREVRRALGLVLGALSLAALAAVVVALLRAVGRGPGGVGPGVLLFLLGILMGGIGLLAGSRWLEARVLLTRRAEAAARARARPAPAAAGPSGEAESPRPRRVEAILLVDLVQSTELIGRHGDKVFRDLLRRIEATFIPLARRQGARHVDGHGDGLLFCFDRAQHALDALRGMYAQIPDLSRGLPAGVEPAFRASLHVGETTVDARGNRSGLAVLKAVRLGSTMERLRGRGAGRNCLVVSAEAAAALREAGARVVPLGEVALRDFPGAHPVYEVEV